MDTGVMINRLMNGGFLLTPGSRRIREYINCSFSSYRIQDTRYRIQDTGYRIQDTGYRIHDTGYMIQDT